MAAASRIRSSSLSGSTIRFSGGKRARSAGWARRALPWSAAGGASEAGKFLRVPGTNPFFPLPHGLQGNRLLELLATHPIETYLLNTGRVGGTDGDDRSKKLRIPDTSACVKGIAEQTIVFDEDPDFGYQVATSVPELDDAQKLQPRRLYEAQGRAEEYRGIVERLKSERVTHLRHIFQRSER